jgi:hypothetical protein
VYCVETSDGAYEIPCGLMAALDSRVVEEMGHVWTIDGHAGDLYAALGAASGWAKHDSG